jgi:hypothetical protein
VNVQLSLGFIELSEPNAPLWEQIDAQAQKAVIDALARLIVKAACPDGMVLKKEETTDDR